MEDFFSSVIMAYKVNKSKLGQFFNYRQISENAAPGAPSGGRVPSMGVFCVNLVFPG